MTSTKEHAPFGHETVHFINNRLYSATMQVELLPKIHDPQIVNMPYWYRIFQYLDKEVTKRRELRSIDKAHKNTKTKILFADYHYHILNQVYAPKATKRHAETPKWALAEMDSIIVNLYSALDSLANEINILYNFQIDIRNICIHHNVVEKQHASYKNDNCLRCRLSRIDDKLSQFLEHELGHDWFSNFKDTRVQMVHRDQPIYLQGISHGDPEFPNDAIILLLPNQPCKENPQMHDYSKHYDFNTYSQERRIDVVTLIEQAYKLMEPKIMAL